VADSSAYLLHTTIAGNSGGDGSGSGINVTEHHGTYSTVALTNTILASHTVGITVTSGNTVTVNGILWYSTPTTISQAAGASVTVLNEYLGDPVFLNPDVGDYHIGPGSAALDRGVDAGVAVDIDGESRPVGARCDLGADEFPAALEVSKWASPDPVQAGQQLTYGLHVTNTGHVTLHTTVTDVLPAHVTPGGPLIWTPIITAPNGDWTQTVVVTVDMDYTGPLTNVVTVTTDEGATGSYTTTSTAVSPTLNVVKESSAASANVGETITYTYTLENLGAVTLTNVSADDNRLEAISLATTTLAPGAITTGSATYTVVTGDLPGPLTNTVVVTGRPPTGPDVIGMDVQTVTLTGSSITITKEASVTHTFVFTGDLGTFELTTGDSWHSPPLAADNYTVAEDPTSFPDSYWALLNVVCVDRADQTVPVDVDLGNFSAVIPVGPDQHLTCTFLNERAGFEEVYYLLVIFKNFRP